MAREQADQLPRLSMLRELTDRRVLDQLLAAAPLTRAEVAQRTGISKPTVSESVRRLSAAGVVLPDGHQQGRRGPSGTFYRVRPEASAAVAVTLGPDGVLAERYDATGRPRHRHVEPVATPIDAGGLGPLLRRAVERVLADAPAAGGLAVSVAGPVDHRGRVVALPDSPFLLGELDPAAHLPAGLRCPVAVDNDVNWAALAEQHDGAARDLGHFFYAYLGPGLGGATVTGGSVQRGHGGLAGELAHVRTTGPGGASMGLTECFAAYGLTRPGLAAIDTDRVAALVRGAGDTSDLRHGLARSVAGALASVTALLNPQAVVVGGPWGATPGWSELLGAELATQAAVPTEVRRSVLGLEAPLAGARSHAVAAMQAGLSRAGL